MLIRELFREDVTRDIPPVVYFHEQSPEKVRDEVGEYIITGGWPSGHPNHARVPDGIHEQYVRLLTGICRSLEESGGPSAPVSWISGFYGSGKSSFAKLLGLALDGMELPGGGSLAEALLNRDFSDRATEFRNAWNELRRRIESPFAVVFDIGGFARDNEHIHSACVRQVQARLEYCPDPLVARFELRLEQAGDWERFLEVARKIGHPWEQEKNEPFADETFSEILHHFDPDRYTDPMSWIDSRAGTTVVDSAAEAVSEIGEMMKFRRPRGTLFMVVDEVSQYVVSQSDREDKLRAFTSELGSQLKGRAWLLALGQQRIDEQAGERFLLWAKDRFPPHLRVHLAATNIRDVVHRRLLQKTPAGEEELRRRFEKHRPDLQLFAYGCDNVSADEFVEVYPLLPGQIDLLLQITSAMRVRSARAQGDDQAIRGLLQLLGELFRDRKLAELEVGQLVTLDQIYEVQKTALDSDTQASMARLLNATADRDPLLQRAAKAVALLELIQETQPTDARLVAQCLYEAIDRGDNVRAVTDALEELRRDNLLSYSEKQGYRIQSTAGEEWERQKRDLRASREAISEIIGEALKSVMEDVDRPTLQRRPFPWAVYFSDGRNLTEETLIRPRDEAVVTVDFRLVPREEQTESTWVERSDETAMQNRLLWVCGDTSELTDRARSLVRSRLMVRRNNALRESLSEAKKRLLQDEEGRIENLESQIRDLAAAAWMSGRVYFRGKTYTPGDFGNAFPAAILRIAERIMTTLYPHFDPITLQPADLEQLLQTELPAPSAAFLGDGLGILELDSGRYVPSCSGVIPTRIRDYIESEDGVSGSNLLTTFAGPPHACQAEVIKACVLGLLRGGKLTVETAEGTTITAVRDAGVREVFDRTTGFRRAQFIPAGEDDIGVRARARICRFFQEQLDTPLDRDDNVIADAVDQHFRKVAERLRDVQRRLDQLPGMTEPPPELEKLNKALEHCLRKVRETRPTVVSVKKWLDQLLDGVKLLKRCEGELTEDALRQVQEADNVRQYELAQLEEIGAITDEVAESGRHVCEQLALQRPWADIRSIQSHLETIRQAYTAERQRLIEWQGQQVEQARGRISLRDGYSTLSGEKSHNVLRPINQAATDTTAEATFPTLRDLKDPFTVRLQEAERTADALLDDYLSTGPAPAIVPVQLGLHNREVRDEAEVDALVEEIRQRLLEQIRNGQRVRLI